MPDFTVSFESCMEAARLASSRGDRLGAEQALDAAIAAAEANGGVASQRTAALMKLGELKRDAGNLAEAEELFGRAVEISEGAGAPDDSAFVAALTNLAAMRTARGAPDQAEALLTRALTLSERRLGRDHPDLVVLLNDLSRLYLKRSAFALAEPLLLRLHAIKRVKGEEHPEVATVLASLAAVRQALGDHDAAEQLWRRVLAIRERTLAPNHFAIATALEHLAETCSARGKVAEALRLFHRALAMREMTLGAGHPSLRASRERIADLQLQDSEEFAANDDTPLTASTTDWRLPVRGDHPALGAAPISAPMPPLPLASAARVVAPPTPLSFVRDLPAREPVMQPVARSTQAPAPVAQHAAPPMQQVAPSLAVGLPGAYAQPMAPELEVPAWTGRDHPAPTPMTLTRSIQPVGVILPSEPADAVDDDVDLLDDYEPVGGRMHNISASLGGLLRERKTQAVVAGVVTLALIAYVAATGSQPRAASAEPSFIQPTQATGYVAAGVTELSDTVAGRSTAAANLPAAADEANPRVVAPAPEKPRPEPPASVPVVSKPAASPTPPPPAAARIPNPGDFARPLAGVSTAQLDAAMRSAATSGPALTQVPVVSTSFTPSDNSFGKVDYGASPAKQSPPILIGAVPRVPYPQNLRAKGRETGGEVLVEFRVDTLGQPDMGSVTIVHSDHDLLTAAVRRVIPSMRFVPAQHLGRKAAGTVQVPFHFSVARK